MSKELKAPDKVTQKMTRDGAVAENLTTGETSSISEKKMLNIKKELLVFFCACLTGVNVRAGYEILIFLRKMIIHNNLVKGIEDLFYWIFMSAYIFSQIYATMYGSIRWYFLLGLVFGVVVIQKLISSGEKIHKKTRKNLEIIRKNR